MKLELTGAKAVGPTTELTAKLWAYLLVGVELETFQVTGDGLHGAIVIGPFVRFVLGNGDLANGLPPYSIRGNGNGHALAQAHGGRLPRGRRVCDCPAGGLPEDQCVPVLTGTRPRRLQTRLLQCGSGQGLA